MQIKGDKATGIQIAYIGGGSRGWAWKLMSDLALEGNLSGEVKLYDIDHQAAKDNEVFGNFVSQRDDAVGKWRYKAVRSLEEALVGADFAIISILPGTFQEMAADVHLPEEYGIYQSVGDTTGPGGIIRALRTIPMYVEIAEAIKEFAPDAWVISYTNPLSLCVKTLYEVFPDIKAFGCCHEVFGTQNILVGMVKETLGASEVTREDIKVNVLGINHFTWIDQATYGHYDLFPLYREFVSKYFQDGYEPEGAGSWLNSVFSSAERVKFDLFRRYGLIAAAGDRHLVEFLPRSWYLQDPETARQWKFHLTPVDWRIANKKRLQEMSKQLINNEISFELQDSGEEGVRQIKGLLGLGDFVTNVNVPNHGQMPGFPKGAIVETNAEFSCNSIRPLVAGDLPSDVKTLVMRHALNQETVFQAAIGQDKELAFRAFVNDPLVTIDLDKARELFNRMLANTKAFLPGWSI